MNPKKRKPAGRITPHWWCHVVFFSRVAFSFRLARCSESRGSASVACGRKSPRLLPKMWPQCDWNIYIFPDNWTASVLEQHCCYNENVFRSHLYSYVAATSSSSLPLISSLYVLYDRMYFTWLFCVFLPAAYFLKCFSFCFLTLNLFPVLLMLPTSSRAGFCSSASIWLRASTVCFSARWCIDSVHNSVPYLILHFIHLFKNTYLWDFILPTTSPVTVMCTGPVCPVFD